MPKRMTQDEYIAKANAVHGNRYDYSKTVYARGSDKIIIICPEHGEFLQRANSHINDKQGCPVCAHRDRANTCLDKYGNAYPFLSDESRRKSEQICEERYGGRSAFASSDIRAKAKRSVRDKYGVDNPMQADAVKQKAKNTNLKRYGVACTMQNESVKAKHRKSVKQHYGVENVMQAPEVREKAVASFKDRYGVDNPRKNAEIDKKIRETNTKKYGVEYAIASDPVRKKIVKVFLDKYGHRNPMQSDDVKQKAANTNTERYGCRNPMQSDSIKQKAANTNIKRYGVCYPMQLPEFVDRSIASKVKNETLNISFAEDRLYDMLVDVFGKNDVHRAYKSERYPFYCDFYVVSKDLYIELNASWTHGSCWYDADRDAEICKLWSEKAQKSNYYKNALETWTIRDVRKRDTAKQNSLNYVVFWDSKLRDAALWFAMGCPVGHDYTKIYSWLSERDLKRRPVLVGSTYSTLARHYQYNVFYEKEIVLWNDDAIRFSGMAVRPYIYYNRLVYQNKLPDELSDKEILRAFKISGVHRSYSIFDTKLFDEVVQKYNIRSVYDPCAGWGERMLYCKDHDVRYTGVDINEKLEAGYLEMIEDLDITEQQFVLGDAASVDIAGKYDAAITCPPYGSTEIYSEAGAENFSPTEFLQWWKRVVSKASAADIKYFCFQINQKYRDDMTAIVIQSGFVKIDEFVYDKNKSSHFTRKNGVNSKKEYEIMLVFTK